MASKFQKNFTSPSSSNLHPSFKAIGVPFKELYVSTILCRRGNPRKKAHLRHTLLEYDKHSHRCGWLECREHRSPFWKVQRTVSPFSPWASTDDGVTVNGTPQTSSSNDMEEMRIKLNQSLESEDLSNGLIQSLHDAARVFELAIKEQRSVSAIPWLSTAWLGIDKNASAKKLSYQASVYSLLQAASEISLRGDGRDRDVNVFVQRSLLRQSAPLESSIREAFSAKEPATCEWFWSQQLPMVATNFVNYFERNPSFSAATIINWNGAASESGNTSDLSLLMLVLSCIAAITKLGPAKVSCSQFFSMIPDVTGRLMDMLVDYIPIHRAYHSMKDIGLRREFLVHFGPRAAACRVKNDRGAEEIAFWVDLVQQQLQRAIDREKIWSRLTTCESIKVLEKDLAIFGFFIALGRSTQFFLSANSFDAVNNPVESLIRYLIGGSVLYYPQFSSISSYQLYVEVVCEELEWLPFYPNNSDSLKQSREKKANQALCNEEAICQVLDACSHWMQSFIKYSTWLENPSNIKAAQFLSRGHNKLKECMLEPRVVKNKTKEDIKLHSGEKLGSGAYLLDGKELESFDKALQNVEEALKRLEELLQELHVSSSNSGKEHLKAACCDLERIRRLKKEAEFLEASFRAKADSLQQGDDDGHLQPSISNQIPYSKTNEKNYNLKPDGTDEDRRLVDRVSSKPRGLWSLLVHHSTRKSESGSSTVDQTEDESCEKAINVDADDAGCESNEIHRFEALRHELIELEKRVQRSTEGTRNKEEKNLEDESDSYSSASGLTTVKVQKKESIIGKSIGKLKEAGTDVWQGTQLLAIDVGAAVGFLSRALTGDELTEKEKKALRRTLTDLASVVPIGILMLLPVTAVGHAAILAAIQRYVPALIPSTYAPERLDLLRQLEKVKEMETGEMSSEDSSEANSLCGNTPADS